MFHNAGFVEAHVARDFESKEAYLADLARAWLPQHGVPTRTIAKVAAAILSTRVDADLITVERKVGGTADQTGLAADYETFWRNTANLETEHKLLYGVGLGWSEWVGNANTTNRFYLSPEICLTSYFV